MEQLSNISQLRNLWLRSPAERLACWREFRLELQDKYTSCSDPVVILEHINTWWKYVPIVSVAMDPFNRKTWPSIWELIYQGECCKYSRGLALAYNMHYIDQDINVKVSRVFDTKNNDEYFIAIWNDSYVLNSLYGDIVDFPSVDTTLDIRESWMIQDIVCENY